MGSLQFSWERLENPETLSIFRRNEVCFIDFRVPKHLLGQPESTRSGSACPFPASSPNMTKNQYGCFLHLIAYLNNSNYGKFYTSFEYYLYANCMHIKKQLKDSTSVTASLLSGPSWDRTSDPLIMSQVLRTSWANPLCLSAWFWSHCHEQCL